MNSLQRAACVLANEGPRGLGRRIARKVTEPARVAEAKLIYQRQVDAFRDRCQALGITGIEDFYWYHTVDLGDGLVTPGDYDFRDQLDAFQFPDDMRGTSALDVGSATGFFAFEFERRGAQVTSVELPSIEDWDVPTAEKKSLRRENMQCLNAATAAEANRRHLDGPFQFCRTMRKSNVERCYSTVYNLLESPIGNRRFDFIYAGDILLHLFSPLKALDVLAELCGKTLMLTIDSPFPVTSTMQPLMRYMGGDRRNTDGRTWWMFNHRCIEEMLKRLGFHSVSVVGRYSGVMRRALWGSFQREVIRAERS